MKLSRKDMAGIEQLFLYSPFGEKQRVVSVKGAESGFPNHIEIITAGKKTKWRFKIKREEI